MLRILLCLVLVATPAAADGLSGRVGHVRDGDTFIVGGQPVRLWGLHAPELREPGGEQAKAFMERLVLGQVVVCARKGRSHDRIVARCWLGNQDVAEALVEAGLGRDCPAFSGGLYATSEQPQARHMTLPRYCD
jgi:endonuclease YncB( thermonuclease family)